MSGGSWDYLYAQDTPSVDALRRAADRLRDLDDPLTAHKLEEVALRFESARALFFECSVELRLMEWIDSGDKGADDYAKHLATRGLK